MSPTAGALIEPDHHSGGLVPVLGESNFSNRPQGLGAGKIIQIELTPAKTEMVLAAGARVTVQLDTNSSISIPGHPESLVMPFDRGTQQAASSVELILSSAARVVDGKLIDPVRASMANERGDSKISYSDGSTKIVTNNLGISVVINSASDVRETPQRMSEAA